MNTFTRRADKIGQVIACFWAATLIPLVIMGFWYPEAWAVAGLTTAVTWLTATAIAYDSRYQRH